MGKSPQGILHQLGWNSFFEDEFRRLQSEEWQPCRVISQQRDSCTVQGESGELNVTLAGRLRYQADNADAYPVVGDWVAVTVSPREKKGIIQAILPRKSSFMREAVGGPTREQVVAANVDTVFLVSGLDGGRNFNLRSIERYLTVAWNSGAQPVIVLNKADVCEDVPSRVNEAEFVASGVPVHAVSALTGLGLELLSDYIVSGSTVALLGRSGVGKSAIINALLGEERQAVREVRESDRRGRHTTTRRELVLLPSGGVVIDTPGMREIQLWGEESALGDAFDDIERLAGDCRFADCRHDTEPGCAVREAIQRGDIDDARFRSYLRLKRELMFLEARRNDRVRIEEKERWKKISQWAKRLKKDR